MERTGIPLSNLVQLRQRIVDLYQGGVHNKSAIARELKVSRPTVARAIALFEKNGMTGLSPGSRGRKVGAGRLLAPAQELSIRRRLHAGPPDPAVHGDSQWTRASVLALVRDEVGRNVMSSRTLNDYLKRWGVTASGANVRAAAPGALVATVAVSRRHMLWELLAWAPVSTLLARQLAQALCTTSWQGQYLFLGLSQRWTFQRTRQSLQRLYSAVTVKRSLLDEASRATAKLLSGFDIDAHWRSARRQAWQRELLAAHPDDQHWSLRVVPVLKVTVAHTRTTSRHTGPTPVSHTSSPGLLLAALRFDARPFFHAELIDAPATEEGEAQLIARSKAFFAALHWAPSEQVRLHVPVGAVYDQHYGPVLYALRSGAAEITEDMPPPFITPGARATVDIPMTALRSRGGLKVMPTAVTGYVSIDRNPPAA